MKNKKPTFIIFTPGFPADETDTTCLPFLQIFLKNLKETYPGLNIIVLTLQYPFFKGSYLWHEIEIISFNGYKKRKLFKLMLWNRINRRLKDLENKNNITGILSLWCNECALIGNKFAKKNDLTHYCWLWGQDAKKENKFVKKIRPVENELIALSDFLQSEFEKNFRIRPAHVIPPGIDIRSFNEKNFRKDIDVLGVGWLNPLKQFDIFLNVINELKKDLPSIKAVLCGRGSEEENLQQLRKKFDLDTNVQFTGETPHPEVLQLMQRSKILLHPSSYEGFGCVCNEALYAGAEVISFCKPMNEQIEHWHIVNSEDEMLRKALEILRSGYANHQPVLPYTINDIVKKIMNLFQYKEEIAS